MLKLKYKTETLHPQNNTIFCKAMPSSLGHPIGLTQATLNQRNLKSEYEQDLISMATCYMAFAMSNVKSISTWTSELINEILFMAIELLRRSENKLFETGMVNKLSRKSILKSFPLYDNWMDIEVCGPEIVGNLQVPKDRKVNSLLEGLRIFFRRRKTSRACLLQADESYFIIWNFKTCYFYVFDSLSRTAEFKVNNETGMLTLFCLETLENITHLIVNMSNFKGNEYYCLFELQINNCIKGLVPADKRTVENVENFVVLNEHCAIVRGTFHCGSVCFKETRNAQAIIICCMALVYDKIHSSNSWTSKIINKILMLGNEEYKKNLMSFDYSIANIPSAMVIGKINVNICCQPNENAGHVVNAKNIESSELFLEMKYFFVDHNYGILIVDNIAFGVWHVDGMYFLFDPYSRNEVGEVSHDLNGVSFLQMHSTLQSLCGVFLKNLLNLMDGESFYIHAIDVKVTNLMPPKHVGEMPVALQTNSVDSIFVPQMDCKLVDVMKQVENNLDAPALSDTQLIQSWKYLKQDMFKCEEEEELSDFSDDAHSQDTIVSASDSEGPPQNNALGLSNRDYERLKTLNLTDDDIKSLQLQQQTAKDMENWAKLKIDAKNAVEILELGITYEEYKPMHKLGLTIEDIKKLQELGLTPTEYNKYKKKGISPDDIKNSIDSKKQIETFKKLNLSSKEIKKLQELGISAAQYEAYMKLGLTYNEVLVMTQLKLTANEYVKMKSMGLTSEDIANVSKLETTPEIYMKMKEMKLPLIKMKKLIQLKISPSTFEKLNMLNIGFGQMDKFAKSGMTPEEYQKTNDDLAPKDFFPETDEQSEDENSLPNKHDEKDNVGTEQGETANKEPEQGETADKESEQGEIANKEPEQGETANGPKKDDTIPQYIKKEMISEQSVQDNATHEQGTQDKVQIKQENTTPQQDTKSTARMETIVKVENVAQVDSKKTVLMESISNVIHQQDLTASSNTSELVPLKVKNVDSGTTYTSQIIDILPDSKKTDPYQSKMNDLKAHVMSSEEKKLQNQNKHDVVVVQSSTGSTQSIDKLIRSSFQIANRIIILNGNGVPDCMAFLHKNNYYLYAVCACNIDAIRKIDLQKISELLRPYKRIEKLITKIVQRMSPVGPQQKFEKRIQVEKKSGFVRQLFAHKFDDINKKFTDVLDEYYNISKKQRD